MAINTNRHFPGWLTGSGAVTLVRLLDLADCPQARETAVSVADALLHAVQNADGVRHFVGERLDLVAHLVVGRAAQTGDK